MRETGCGARQPPTAADIEARRDALYERLEAGYERIVTGLDQGRDVTNWEDLWLTLLNEYEAVIEQLQRDLAV